MVNSTVYNSLCSGIYALRICNFCDTHRMRLNNSIYKNRIILKILKYLNLIISISLIFLSALGKSGKIPKVIILIQHEPQVCCIHWGVPTWIHDKNFWPIVCVSVSVSVWVWCICVWPLCVCAIHGIWNIHKPTEPTNQL